MNKLMQLLLISLFVLFAGLHNQVNLLTQKVLLEENTYKSISNSTVPICPLDENRDTSGNRRLNAFNWWNILNSFIDVFAAEAYADEVEDICSMNIQKEGRFGCNEQYDKIQKACVNVISKIRTSDKIGESLRKDLEEKIDSWKITISCVPEVDGGCAETIGNFDIGPQRIKLDNGAFNGQCGCFEAVFFHEVIHTVQVFKKPFEKAAYCCESKLYDCGKIDEKYTKDPNFKDCKCEKGCFNF